MTLAVILVALATYIINIPAGFWRHGLKKFSLQWFIAIHAAVPLVILLRVLAGIEWRPATIAFLVLCYFLGQYSGKTLRARLQLARPQP